MRRCLIGGAVIAAMGLAGCQSTPEPKTTRYSVAAAERTPTPITVLIAVKAERRAGPKTNQLGGEIPDAKPTTPVSDGGLGEIR